MPHQATVGIEHYWCHAVACLRSSSPSNSREFSMQIVAFISLVERSIVWCCLPFPVSSEQPIMQLVAWIHKYMYVFLRSTKVRNSSHNFLTSWQIVNIIFVPFQTYILPQATHLMLALLHHSCYDLPHHIQPSTLQLSQLVRPLSLDRTNIYPVLGTHFFFYATPTSSIRTSRKSSL